MIYSALVVGLLGSVHCLGMCGPLALALPVKQGSRWSQVGGRLLYNGGRIFTYSLLGLLMGWLGQGLAFSTSQQQLSVVIGLVLLIILILPSRITQRFSLVAPVARFTARLKGQFRTLFQQRSNPVLFLMGLLNGLLPCGLVYVALAGAVAMGSGPLGMSYMALFGLGTLPVMLATSLAGQWISLPKRVKLSRLAPAFTLALAGLLILRGLNLGIPMVSPQVMKAGIETKLNCCHKP